MFMAFIDFRHGRRAFREGRSSDFAAAIGREAKTMGIEIRAGLHTGEVLVSNTTRYLVAGSGITFEARGTHVLKGVPGEWRLFQATNG